VERAVAAYTGALRKLESSDCDDVLVLLQSA
jgi:hypothetical protein